jgi:hypothetical protein
MERARLYIYFNILHSTDTPSKVIYHFSFLELLWYIP